MRLPTPVALELRRHVREHHGDGLLFRTPRSDRPLQRHEFFTQAWRPVLGGGSAATDQYKSPSTGHSHPDKHAQTGASRPLSPRPARS
jgi:hypothetical protein